MASSCFLGSHDHEILVQRGFSSAAKAYNDAIARSRNDLIVFAHQDILFPASWLSDLHSALRSLEVSDPKWGVLGCYGITPNEDARGYVYSPRCGILGKPFDSPALVQTLDEIVLVIRKSSGLNFDWNLPYFHFYGADICMTAAERGMNSYAISALCIHNHEVVPRLPLEFYRACGHIRKRWKEFLPIQTTCAKITRSNYYVYKRQLYEAYSRFIRRKEIRAPRVEHGLDLLAELEHLHSETAVVATKDVRCV